MRSIEYRGLADQCRKIASLLKGDPRAELLEIAAEWDRLAEDSEKRSGSYFTRGLTARPAA
ncbi:MAG TPA: hypothetical protein VFW28_17725 [Micropepsaceae bacterium]|nr:hypothetical protein [Micropepsaceae bacterium]